MAFNVDSNGYTLGFATLIVVGVAVMLSSFSVLLKERSDRNVILDKKMSIVKSVDPSVTKLDAEEKFKAVKAFWVDSDGNAEPVSDMASVLNLNLKKELKKCKKEPQNCKMPLYVYKDKSYIIPLFGAGLWDAIGGFIALKPDFTTVEGALFNHVGETPGLGAEITKDWFQNNFKNEKIRDAKGEYVGIKVLKGKGSKTQATTPHQVDGMSGATITGDGLQAMLDNCLIKYMPYFKKQK